MMEQHLKSLIKLMFPIEQPDFVINGSKLLATEFSLSPHWKSLAIIGKNQIQRNGLLLQVYTTELFFHLLEELFT